MVVKSIFIWFELALRLRINLHKSIIDGMGVEESEKKRFSLMLHCGKWAYLLNTYEWRWEVIQGDGISGNQSLI